MKKTVTVSEVFEAWREIVAGDRQPYLVTATATITLYDADGKFNVIEELSFTNHGEKFEPYDEEKEVWLQKLIQKAKYA